VAQWAAAKQTALAKRAKSIERDLSTLSFCAAKRVETQAKIHSDHADSHALSLMIERPTLKLKKRQT
jgi:hypothetical protein